MLRRRRGVATAIRRRRGACFSQTKVEGRGGFLQHQRRIRWSGLGEACSSPPSEPSSSRGAPALRPWDSTWFKQIEFWNNNIKGINYLEFWKCVILKFHKLIKFSILKKQLKWMRFRWFWTNKSLKFWLFLWSTRGVCCVCANRWGPRWGKNSAAPSEWKLL